MLYQVISAFILIVSLLLIFVVMIQNSKGGGLASGFSSANKIMGVRKATETTEKITWSLAGALVFCCILITAFIPDSKKVNQSEIQDQVNKTVTIDPNALAPDFGTAQQSKAGSVDENKGQSTEKGE